METIHPNDIQELDADTFSFITLKNGNMIMIDDSVPEKPKTTKLKNDIKSNNEKIPQELKVSEQLTIAFEGKKEEKSENIDEIKKENSANKIIVKSDFNLISKITENTKFTFFGNPIKNISKNIPKTEINKNRSENESEDNSSDKNNEKSEKTEKTEKTEKSNIKSLNNFSPIISSNTNNNVNLNQNLLNDKLKNSQYDENETSRNKIINSNNNEENKEENNIDARIRRKSRNYLDKIEKLFDKNKHTVKAVISLNIPSDIPYQISPTQKQFNMLVNQLRQKQHKYKRNKNDINYQRYYELYKDKSSRFDGVLGNINRIKYYHEAEADDKENDIFFNVNDINSKNSINNIGINNINNTSKSFYGGLNNNINKSINYNMMNGSNDYNLNKTMFSFNGNKTRASSENKFLNSKFGGNSFGYTSPLIFPSNRFVRKIGSYY